jgi:hypothetical protein
VDSDGRSNRSPVNPGCVGGVGANGQAQRHGEGYLDVAQNVFGSTPGAAVTTSPRSGGWVQLPKNPTGPALTTGTQRKGR